jgi:hypothetical protein
MARTTTCMSRLTFLFMAGWLLTLASPASAITYIKFYNGGSTYSGPYGGSGTIYDYLSTNSVSTTCPDTYGSCSSDILSPSNGASLKFNSGLIDATATVGVATSKVWDDLTPNYGGLGVGSGSPSDTDQIASATSDLLTLTFSSQVALLGVATLFDGATGGSHTPFGAGFPNGNAIKSAETASPGSLVFSLNGSDVSFLDANSGALFLVGQVFTFAAVGDNPDFYVSALQFGVCGKEISCETTITPIPGALPLFATGLGALGVLGWRRKRKPARAG